MRIPARPEPARTSATVTPEAPVVAGGPGPGSADAARASADRTADALLAHIEQCLRTLLQATEAEEAPRTGSEDPHRAGSAERWHAPARAWAEAAAATARGDLVAAVSRIRHAEQLEAEARAGARAHLPELPTGPEETWRRRVPGVFATARAVPVAIDTLVEAILAHRGGLAARAIGSDHGLHHRPVPDAPEEEEQDDGLAG